MMIAVMAAEEEMEVVDELVKNLVPIEIVEETTAEETTTEETTTEETTTEIEAEKVTTNEKEKGDTTEEASKKEENSEINAEKTFTEDENSAILYKLAVAERRGWEHFKMVLDEKTKRLDKLVADTRKFDEEPNGKH